MFNTTTIRRSISYLLFPILLFCSLTASANFDFNANCLKAYQNIFELKLNTARQLISNEKKARPNNSIIPLLENYVDYFYLLSTESKSEFERLEENKSIRLDQISDDDKTSPYYLYAQAEINLQWALIRSKYGSYLTSAREINKAHNLLTENSKKFPGFHLNAKGLGLINAIMGALPDGFLKSTLSTFGIKGDMKVGINSLEKLAENLPKSAYEPFYEETVFYYVYVLADLANDPSTYAKTMKYTDRFADDNLLKTYLQAHICIKTNHNDEAITILANRPSGAIYQAFPYFDYLMGIAKLNKLDYNAATYFERFLQTNKGVNYIKDSNLHLGWVSFLKGDNSGFATSMAKVRSVGYNYHERDKQALNEANAPLPNKDLLKARLLFDGGYLTKALDMLADSKAEDFSAGKDRTEYYYRLGRINDELKKDDVALSNYQNAINNGKNLKYYYAAKAAVLIGKIYEQKKNYSKAKANFNLAIAMKDHEFENSIELEAKQGLKRIGG